MTSIDRRALLKLMAGSVALTALPWLPSAAFARDRGGRVAARDDRLALEFDDRLWTRLGRGGAAITAFSPSEAMLLGEAEAGTTREVDTYAYVGHREEAADHPRHGPGRRTIVRGRSAEGIEKQVTVTLFDRAPGLAIVQASYRNGGDTALAVAGWRGVAHTLAAKPEGFWTFSGATHTDRRDWVRRLDDGFDQRNTLGMDSSDYGGGTPVANVWRRDVGLAVGHVEPLVKPLAMPVSRIDGGAAIAVESSRAMSLAPGAVLETDHVFVMLHDGDHFAPLVAYRDFMQAEGIVAPEAPESAFAPVWCAWGYERDFTTEQVLATLPKVRELGFEWAVLDDGWQTNEGDWAIDLRKFPRGDADMRAFTDAVRAQGLRPRLWLAPLAAEPGSDVLHDHVDMLLLDENGAFQTVTWWNALTQCPAYAKTVDFYVALTKKAIGDWGFEGLKLDGQHLNAVAPCHNPLHGHARPEDSSEKLVDFWLAIHKAAHDANPDAVVELCPCGTAFAFHNLPATDQFPSSDPLSSWQVRHKGKSVKALMGARSSYAGDHVELSDNRDDFASSVGIGAVISTKFTWPRDTDRPSPGPLPPGGHVLTAAKEATWRKWVELYKAHMLPKGEYLGGLYDIGFDRPEAHAIAKDGALYYAFYADAHDGPVQLRGLGEGRWTVRDLFNDAALGTVDAKANTVAARFERFLLLQAVPESRA